MITLTIQLKSVMKFKSILLAVPKYQSMCAPQSVFTDKKKLFNGTHESRIYAPDLRQYFL